MLPVVHLSSTIRRSACRAARDDQHRGRRPADAKLANDCNVALAVSLHAPTDELRNKLVPINKVHPIAELLEACWNYAEGQASRSITFEYVLLDDVNDSVAQARQLVKLLRNRPAKVNLIPFNAFPESEFRARRSRRSRLFGRRCATGA